MKKKLFTLLTLLVCVCTGAWATDVTVGRTLSSASDTDYTLSDVTNTTVTIEDGTGQSGTSKGNIYTIDNPNTKTTYAAKCFRDLGPGKSGNITAYNADYYAGYQLVIASGYKLTASQINVKVAASANFSYTVKILDDDGDVLYEPIEEEAVVTKTIGGYSGTSPTNMTASFSPTTVLTGTVHVRLYYWNTGNSGSKYIVPQTFTLTGALEVDATTSYDMAVTVADGQSAYGTATVSSASVLEGKSVTFTATPNTGYKFVNWTNTTGGTVASTSNPYTISNVAQAYSLTANFAAAKQVSFSGYGDYDGTRNDNTFCPLALTSYADGNDEFSAPTNLYLYSENKTLTGWSDGSTTHAVGTQIDCSAGNKTLTPVFTANSGASLAATLNARTAAFNVTWNFGSDYAKYALQGQTAYYVQQATVNEATVDVPLFIDATSGKFNDEGNNATRAQINGGTVLTVPVLNGSVVTLSGYHAFGTTDRQGQDCEQTTINGVTTYDLSNENKTATYTYSGDAGTIDIVVGGDMAWGYTLEVTYPAPTFAITYATGLANGEITGEATAVTGETVTVTATPDAGYMFGALTIMKTSDASDVTASCSVNGKTFVMPAFPVTVSATFVVEPNVYELNFNSNKPAGVYFNITNGADASNTIFETSINSKSVPKLTDYDYNFGSIVRTSTGTSQLVTKAKYNKISKIEIAIATEERNSNTLAVEVSPNADFSSSVTTVRTAAIFASSNGTYTVVTMTKDSGNNDLNADGYIRITLATDKSSGKYTSIAYVKVSAQSATENISTASGKNYSTYVNANALDFSSVSGDIKAYICASNAAAGKINFTGKDAVPAGTPLLIKTTAAGNNVDVPLTTSADAIATNYLVAGTGAAITYDAGESHFYYILTNGEFKGANNSVVAVGKAYLSLTEAVSARSLNITFDDEETTGISATLMNNERMNNEYFDLQGRRVAQPTKGLYIVNGKKVIIK